MFTFLVVGTIGAVGAFALGVRGTQVRDAASAVRRWKALAARRDGKLLSGDVGFFDSLTLPSLECNVNHVRVHMDVRGHGMGADLRARACYVLPAGPEFSLASRRGVTGLLLGFGGHDVGLGDEELDNRFSLKSKTPEMAKLAWQDGAAEKLHPQATVFSDGKVVDLQITGWKHSNIALDNAVDLVAQLAAADVFGVAALAALPDAAMEYRDGPWDHPSPPEACVLMPDPVRLGPVIDGGPPVTRARANCAKREPFRIAVRDGEAEVTAGNPEIAVDDLDVPGDGDVVCWGDEISFTWTTIITNPDDLMAGAHLVATLARPPAEGVYR
jgi:hypothetical protein